MSADLRSAVIDIGIILKSAAGRSQPHRLEKRPNRDVVQVGRNANSRAMLRRGSRAYTDLAPRRQQNIGLGDPSSWAIGTQESQTSLFGAAQIFVRAGEPVVKRDKLGAERAGQPKVA